jgi:hypothetical protein
VANALNGSPQTLFNPTDMLFDAAAALAFQAILGGGFANVAGKPTVPSGTPPQGRNPFTGTRPELPSGAANTADFGQRIMQWGRGNEAARARIPALTLQELENAGMTRELAEAWRDFDQNVARITPNNPSAAGRADLMQRAVDLFSGGH